MEQKNRQQQKAIIKKIDHIDLEKVYNLINKKADGAFVEPEFRLHQAHIDKLDS